MVLIGLAPGPTLVEFSPNAPGETRSVAVTGIVAGDELVAVDYRQPGTPPTLWGVGRQNVYRIDLVTGEATVAAALTSALAAAAYGSSVDLTVNNAPLRLVGDDDTHVTISMHAGQVGTVTTKNGLSYGPTGPDPALTAIAVADVDTPKPVAGIDTTCGCYVSFDSGTGLITPGSPIASSPNLTLNAGLAFSANSELAYAAVEHTGDGYSTLVTLASYTGAKLGETRIGTNVGALKSLTAIPAATVRFVADDTDFFEHVAGGEATVELNRSGRMAGSVSVSVQVVGGTAEAGVDYTVPSDTTVTFAPNESRAEIVFPLINDATDEFNETIELAITSPAGGVELVEPFETTVLIKDEDAPPSLIVNDQTVTETDSGNVEEDLAVGLSHASGKPVEARYDFSEGGPPDGADSPQDFQGFSGTVEFDPGDTTGTIPVTIKGDHFNEDSEWFAVDLSDAANVTIGDDTMVVTIEDDAPEAGFSVSDVNVTEAAGGVDAVFNVTLSEAEQVETSVMATLAPGTAKEDQDYSGPTTSTLTFPAGTTDQVVTVRVHDDQLSEDSETVTLTLSAPSQADIDDGIGVVTIADNDIGPAFSVGDAAAVLEGDAAGCGGQVALFPVHLSQPAGRVTSVHYRTVEDTSVILGGRALGVQDFCATGDSVLEIPAETTDAFIRVPIFGDNANERNQRFFVELFSPTNAFLVDGRTLASVLLIDDDGDSHRVVAQDGGVFALGDASFHGSGVPYHRPGMGFVAMTVTPSGEGYWLLSTDGGVYAFGDAGFFGSLAGVRFNGRIIGIAATPTGRGYWLAASDGGVFAYGDAKFFGGLGHIKLNQPIVGLAASPTGFGYWLLGFDGGVFAFGDAKYLGGLATVRLNQPVVGISASPTGNGYWLAARDGGVFAFGDAPFLGSFGTLIELTPRILNIASTLTGRGYWLLFDDGRIVAFGDARLLTPGGRVPSLAPVEAIVTS